MDNNKGNRSKNQGGQTGRQNQYQPGMNREGGDTDNTEDEPTMPDTLNS
ncbi:MAG: hypothetical protein WCT01_03815 [Candidatus Shapirobacteria bacterium]